MPLFDEGVFSFLCLLAAISIRVLNTITKVVENTKEPPHFNILNLTPHINGCAMQPVPESPDLSLNSARSADHRGGVENVGAGGDLLNVCFTMAGMIPEILHPVPVGIV